MAESAHALIEPFRPVVHADPDIQDLIPGFLENQRRDLHILQTTLEQGEYDRIRTLAHMMKGAGGGYGFDAITAIAATMEQAAKAGDARAIAQCLEALSVYLDEVIVVYQEDPVQGRDGGLLPFLYFQLLSKARFIVFHNVKRSILAILIIAAPLLIFYHNGCRLVLAAVRPRAVRRRNAVFRSCHVE